jgi:hypothetical protein
VKAAVGAECFGKYMNDFEKKFSRTAVVKEVIVLPPSNSLISRVLNIVILMLLSFLTFNWNGIDVIACVWPFI